MAIILARTKVSRFQGQCRDFSFFTFFPRLFKHRMGTKTLEFFALSNCNNQSLSRGVRSIVNNWE